MPRDDVISIILRRRWIALTAFVLVAAVLIALAFVLPKRYAATSYLLVATKQDQNISAYEQTQVSQALTQTLSQLIKTPAVSDAVRSALPDPSRIADPAADISVATSSTSVVISLTATADAPLAASSLANTYARIFVDESSRISGTGGAQVHVVEPAPPPTGPSSPKKSLFAVAGVLFGALAGIVCAKVRDRLVTRIRVAPDAVDLMGLPILARVPQLPTKAARELKAYGSSNLPTLEVYRLLLANLRFVNGGSRPASIAVVSSSPQEGKSTTAISLARASAELHVSTLLIDADLRRPEASRVFASLSENQDHGLAQAILDADQDSADGLLDRLVIEVPGDATLNLLPSGRQPPNPSVVLASAGLSYLGKAASNRYEFTVFDTPPLTVAADASHVASVVDGVVLVVDARSARRNTLIRALDQLQRSGANVLGIVINRASDDVLDGYGYGYGYGYGGQAPSERETTAQMTSQPPAVATSGSEAFDDTLSSADETVAGSSAAE